MRGIFRIAGMPLPYTFTSFDYPGGTETRAYGINASGEIVGCYAGSGGLHGFLKVGATYTSIDYPGAIWTSPHGINEFRQIVGVYKDSSGLHGFLASPLPLSSTRLLLSSSHAFLAGWGRFRKI